MLYKLDENKYKHTLKFNKNKTIINIKGTEIGNGEPIVIAGPCAIESYELLKSTAKSLVENNCKFLRGGAFKPRTSPYDFQGLKEEGLKILQQVGNEFGLITVTEVTNSNDVDLICKYSDILQVGTRNMQNFDLLNKVGQTDKPILLKRGMSATIEEWLSSAEYIMNQGNKNVILCERGIRSFEKATRNTLDLSAVQVIKNISHLPIIVDPSHATGYREYVSPLAKASIVAGADGIMIEIHENPDKAISDANQTIGFDDFSKLCSDIKMLNDCIKKMN